MAFDSLSERLQASLKKVTGRGKLTEQDIELMMREVRLSLLEADVNYRVVKEFTNEVKQKAMGERVLKSLTPGQQVVKIVHEELQELMGKDSAEIELKKGERKILMMVGLQGAGKTTHAGKLANYLRKKFKVKPLMIAADIYRPAAVNQLVTLGKQLNVDVFEKGVNEKPLQIVKEGLEFAKNNENDLIIIDTAGRLHIDEALMNELKEIKEFANPNEILLTVDAMTGQDAVTVATSFHEQLDVTGAILTKLDGDTRGGAALSIRKVTGVPVKYMGLGEKLDTLEVFHPERMASRILGMGDMLTLIEKATENIDEEEAMKAAEKMMQGKFDFDDYLKQIAMMKKMGSLKGILKFIPGLGSKIKDLEIDESLFKKTEAMISSMTPKERRNPNLINGSRKQRIAGGCGLSHQEINQLIKRFLDTKEQMKRFMKMSPQQQQKMMDQIQNGQMPNMSGMQGGASKSKGKGKNKGNRRHW